jgi:phosphate-selective porin OprO/OprP
MYRIILELNFGNNESMGSKKRKEPQMSMDLKSVFILVYSLVVLGCIANSVHAGEESPVVSGSSLKMSGYSQVEYIHPETGIDGFRIRRARVSLGGEILKKMNYKIQVETMQNPILLDIQVETRFFEQVALRFGQFKVPFSLENLTSSASLDTINRSQTIEHLCPGRDSKNKGRDIGIAVTGHFSVLEYTLGIFNGAGINKSDDNSFKDVAGRLLFFPLDSLSLGVAHYEGKYGPSSGGTQFNKKRTGLELYFSKDRVTLKGEFIFGKDGQMQKDGWYVQGGFDFILEKIQGIFKYDSLDLDRDVRGDRSDVITLGVNWFLAKRTKLQVNYEFHGEKSGNISNDVFLAQFQLGF